MDPLFGGERFRPGERVAVLGRSGSGRTTLLDAVSPSLRAGFGPKDGRRTLLDFAPKGAGGASRWTEVVGAAGLWERRAEPIAALSPGERAAAALAVGLLAADRSPEAVLVADGLFDATDHRRRGDLFTASEGRTLLIATHDLDLAARCERAAIVREGVVVTIAAPEAIRSGSPPARFEVETGAPGATRELVGDFAVDVEEFAGGLRFRARDGQAVAARLLAAGYGTVRSFVVAEPSFADAVSRLI